MERKYRTAGIGVGIAVGLEKITEVCSYLKGHVWESEPYSLGIIYRRGDATIKHTIEKQPALVITAPEEIDLDNLSEEFNLPLK